MTVVDVNTGKFTGSGGNLEETVTKNNLEAAEEIVRQLRLRDIGGIIVVDFIDMVLESNRDLVVRRLVECLGRDRTRHQVAEVTSLGLVQMTRKRIGTGLLESFSHDCEHCHGRGVVVQERAGRVRRRRRTTSRSAPVAATAVGAATASGNGDGSGSGGGARSRRHPRPRTSPRWRVPRRPTRPTGRRPPDADGTADTSSHRRTHRTTLSDDARRHVRHRGRRRRGSAAAAGPAVVPRWRRIGSRETSEASEAAGSSPVEVAAVEDGARTDVRRAGTPSCRCPSRRAAEDRARVRRAAEPVEARRRVAEAPPSRRAPGRDAHASPLGQPPGRSAVRSRVGVAGTAPESGRVEPGTVRRRAAAAGPYRTARRRDPSRTSSTSRSRRRARASADPPGRSVPGPRFDPATVRPVKAVPCAASACHPDFARGGVVARSIHEDHEESESAVYAVVRSGSKQQKVAVGDVIEIDKMA